MADQERVTFRFGREIEIKYLARVPEIGDHVARGSLLWLVTDVQSDDAGPVVVCEPPSRGGAPIGGRHGPALSSWRR
jgi:hypothetical protein